MVRTKGKAKIQSRMDEGVEAELARRSSIQTTEVWPFSRILNAELAKQAKTKFENPNRTLKHRDPDDSTTLR